MSPHPTLSKQDWLATLARYQTPDRIKSVWQIVNSFVPFFLLWFLMYQSLKVSYLLTLALAVPAAGFLMRVFIIQHDCGHYAFFYSKWANDIVGSICGVFTLTPYFDWRRAHSIHHATAGNLDRRGIGDVYTLTRQEYLERDKWGRFKYRFYRNPFVLLGLGPVFTFLISQRVPSTEARRWSKEWYSPLWTNLVIVAIVVALGLTAGFTEFLMIQLPTFLLAATAGVWMFYIQHQFPNTYWARTPEWDAMLAALKGSSFYKLPRLLQWFTGNIGFHHIHHLSARIPNYKLQQCHEENPMFQVSPVTLLESFKCLRLGLWDEERGRLISFRDLKPAAGAA